MSVSLYKYLAITMMVLAAWLVPALPVTAQDADADTADQSEDANPRSAKMIYPLEPFNLPVIKRGKVEGYLMLVILLELERTVPNTEIEQKMPVLRNELNMAARRLASERARPERPLNPSVAAWYMQRAADKALGQKKVRVLIDEALYRTM